jgi:hypothetical protein
MSEQQAQVIEAVRHELYNSHEIVLQGPMQYLDAPAAKWRQANFVMTRAGFLYWTLSPSASASASASASSSPSPSSLAGDVEPGNMQPPSSSLNLARCHLERGTANFFHILEMRCTGWLGGSRPHRFSFQTASTEECSKWVKAVQEMTASVT